MTKLADLLGEKGIAQVAPPLPIACSDEERRRVELRVLHWLSYNNFPPKEDLKIEVETIEGEAFPLKFMLLVVPILDEKDAWTVWHIGYCPVWHALIGRRIIGVENTNGGDLHIDNELVPEPLQPEPQQTLPQGVQ